MNNKEVNEYVKGLIDHAVTVDHIQRAVQEIDALSEQGFKINFDSASYSMRRIDGDIKKLGCWVGIEDLGGKTLANVKQLVYYNLKKETLAKFNVPQKDYHDYILFLRQMYSSRLIEKDFFEKGILNHGKISTQGRNRASYSLDLYLMREDQLNPDVLKKAMLESDLCFDVKHVAEPEDLGNISRKLIKCAQENGFLLDLLKNRMFSYRLLGLNLNQHFDKRTRARFTEVYLHLTKEDRDIFSKTIGEGEENKLLRALRVIHYENNKLPLDESLHADILIDFSPAISIANSIVIDRIDCDDIVKWKLPCNLGRLCKLIEEGSADDDAVKCIIENNRDLCYRSGLHQKFDSLFDEEGFPKYACGLSIILRAAASQGERTKETFLKVCRTIANLELPAPKIGEPLRSLYSHQTLLNDTRCALRNIKDCQADRFTNEMADILQNVENKLNEIDIISRSIEELKSPVDPFEDHLKKWKDRISERSSSPGEGLTTKAVRKMKA